MFNKKAPVRRFFIEYVAEEVRFELTDPFGSPVFKTGAIDHSATLPVDGNIVAASSGAFFRRCGACPAFR